MELLTNAKSMLVYLPLKTIGEWPNVQVMNILNVTVNSIAQNVIIVLILPKKPDNYSNKLMTIMMNKLISMILLKMNIYKISLLIVTPTETTLLKNVNSSIV